MITSHEINSKLKWIEVLNPTSEEQSQLNDQGITSEFLFYALDPNESARTEIDNNTGSILVMYDVMTPDSQALTEPVALVFTRDGNFYSIARNSTSAIADQLFQTTTQTVGRDSMTAIDIYLNGAFVIISEYINAIKNLNRKRNVIQNNLRDHLTENDMISLVELQTQVIYMTDSLQTDRQATQQLQHLYPGTITDVQKEKFQDLIVENSQAVDMSNQAGEVIQSINAAYSSIHNQKLDRSIRLLTVVQAVMAVPTVITGFYGMNVFLPFADLHNAWLIAIFGSAAIIAVELWVLFKNGFFGK
ncbi:MAG: magnesium transporter CorA family protein [Lactobacillaceae bacterium]|jgi:magnesium transporter|nr:magnesium transporter CorA family protein [Lactobacillaceae bacterium]